MPLLRADRAPFRIRQLASTDLEAALGLSAIAGWNQQLDDWRMLFQLAPACSFAAVADETIVGTAMGIDYGAFTWIAMMLVHPQHRGCGIGGKLLEATLDALPSDRPVRLDATPVGRRLYEHFGFVDEAALSRYVADQARPTSINTSHARPMAGDDFAAALHADLSLFGASRRRVLEWAFRSAPEFAFAVAAGAGSIGYCFGRRGRLFDQIGPLAATDPESASALVDAALATPRNRPVAIDVFDGHTAFEKHVGSLGFVVQRPLFRMRLARRSESRGRATAPDATTLSEFAIFGPEFG